MSTMSLFCLENVARRLREAKTFGDHRRFCSVRQGSREMFSVFVGLYTFSKNTSNNFANQFDITRTRSKTKSVLRKENDSIYY